MSTSGRSRRRIGSRLALAVGIVVGLVLPLTVFVAGGGGILNYTVCDRGSEVSSANYWTPYSLTNAPYLGHAYYKATFSLLETFGPTKVVATGILTNGNVSTGYFETQNWTFYLQSNVTSNGPGLNNPCASRYAAFPSAPGLDVSSQGLPLQGPGNTSNAGEPTTFSYSGWVGRPLPSAVFSNGFYTANSPSITTCGTTYKEVNLTSTSFQVTFDLGPGLPPATYTMLSLENWTYSFPANGGTWQVDDLQSNPDGPGGGLAFSWTSC
jgi:hypothetical protein